MAATAMNVLNQLAMMKGTRANLESAIRVKAAVDAHTRVESLEQQALDADALLSEACGALDFNEFKAYMYLTK